MTDLARELREYKELAALLADRLQLAQAENESAYLEAYQAHRGPHFCTDLPFGTPAPAPSPADIAGLGLRHQHDHDRSRGSNA